MEISLFSSCFEPFEAFLEMISHWILEIFIGFEGLYMVLEGVGGRFELCTGSMPFMASSIQPSAWTRLHKRGPRWEEMKTCEQSKTLQLGI